MTTNREKITPNAFVRQGHSHPKRSLRPGTPHPVGRSSFQASSIFLPGEPHPRQAQPPARATARRGARYDVAFRVGNADVRAPAISLPQIDLTQPRWVSAALTLVLGFMLLMMWSSSIFTAGPATVHGNVRISADEINSMLGVSGKSIVQAVPSQIAANLRTAFPDLRSAVVQVGLPNRLSVTVVERTPLLAWTQNSTAVWIDADGVAFPPRGEVQGLVQVSADGSPTNVQNDPNAPGYDKKFIDPAMVQVILGLAPYNTSGTPMVYDPQYGIGWQDPHGWSVYFGQSTDDIDSKLIVYQAIVNSLTRQGTQPTLISLEYLDAPFYK
jgi:hypothetical protein